MQRKKICDSLIRMLLNIPRKTKDEAKAKLNLVNMVTQSSLELEKKGQHMYLPHACHTLFKKKKISFCECLHVIKMP